jgi:hypothetical protein
MQKRTVTYREIENWARPLCKHGDICHIFILANMPKEVKKDVRKQNGAPQILNGYREDSSVYVTITDADNNVKQSAFFMGKSIDKELLQALRHKFEHRIIL